MTTVVFELFEALKKVGVDEDMARKAAQAVVGVEEKEHLATKADILALKTDLAALEARIQAMLNRHLLAVIGAMVGLTAIFSAVLLIALRLVK